jgi:hypothetical protein
MITFLTDLELYRKEGDDCPRCAQAKAEMSHVRERLDRLIENLCARGEAAGPRALRARLDTFPRTEAARR